jgi:PKD repeat protein
MADCLGDSYDIEPVNDVAYVVSHAHDCRSIGAFPDTSPRVRWQHADAYTNAATGVNKGPNAYGWNYNGQPAPTMLHWYPDLGIGTATGQYQAAWNTTSNGGYVALGGEFPTVNGSPQQGLTRFSTSANAPDKVGPQYDVLPARPVPATTVTQVAPGAARVSFGSAWDKDNQNLTYQVYRDRGTAAEKLVKTIISSSNFWTVPTLSVEDPAVPNGTHTYQVRISDPFGNVLLSPESASFTSTAEPSAYAGQVAADGANHHWRLGETGTTAFDAAGTADGTTQSGVSRGVAGAIPGDPDKASSFNGTSTGYIAGGGTAAAAPSEFTVEAWFKTSVLTGGKIVGFGSARTGLSGTYDRHLYLDNTGRIQFGVFNAGTQLVSTPTGKAYNNGLWHHVAASLDSTGMKLYVDGQFVGSNAAATVAQAYQGWWRIGGDNLASWPNRPTSNFLNGQIDEVATYPNALSLAQVQEHYERGGGTVPNLPPVANFTPVATGLKVAFDGSTSNDADGTISSYAWDFGDGSPVGTGQKPNHTYTATGTYSVKLTVTDNDGATATTTKSVSVTNQNPSASFTATPDGTQVAFDASDSADADGTIASYAWDFGDDSTGSGKTVDHTYAGPGTYSVRLTVTDNAGGTDTQTKDVTITANQKPVAAFSSSSTDLRASFDGRASSDPDGSIASYSWDFGDGAAGTGATPEHTYAQAGTYTVELKVTDDDGAADTVSHGVVISAPIAADEFSRSLATGWGSADVGGAWTLTGSSSLFSVTDGSGNIKMAAAGSGPSAKLSTPSSTDTDLRLQFSFDKPPTGGGQFLRAVVRGDQTNGYAEKVWVSSSGAMTIYLTKIVNGTETDITSKAISGLTFQAGQAYDVRVQAWGSNPTNLRAKVWKSGDAEPSTWSVTGTDSTAALQGGGGVSIRAYLSGTATSAPVTMSVDHLIARPTGN